MEIEPAIHSRISLPLRLEALRSSARCSWRWCVMWSGISTQIRFRRYLGSYVPRVVSQSIIHWLTLAEWQPRCMQPRSPVTQSWARWSNAVPTSLSKILRVAQRCTTHAVLVTIRQSNFCSRLSRLRCANSGPTEESLRWCQQSKVVISMS